MDSLTLKSPAKVNLYLRIVGRRSDGYHKLDSLFHRISLHDTLILSKQPVDFSFLSQAQLPPREGNIIFKAYEALRKKFKNLPGAHVELIKRIPIGAGLGGGSSNAAFFLLGMKKLYRLRISNSELMKIGLKVGADVPFFLAQTKQALAGGIGEKLKSIPCRKKNWFLLLTEAEPLSTVAVYSRYREKKIPFSKGRIEVAAQVNDLQEMAIQLRPSIEKSLKQLVRLGAKAALMSGSGPTVFAVENSRRRIQKIWELLPRETKRRAILCSTF